VSGTPENRHTSTLGASRSDFATIQEAETDAIAWAREQGTTELQIEGPNN